MSNKKHIKFPSIEQFRNVIANIKRQHEFAGLDETGEAIYDRVKPKPLLTFSSTIKVHGTNAYWYDKITWHQCWYLSEPC